MEEFILNCLKLQVGESVTYEVYSSVKFVGDMQTKEINGKEEPLIRIMLNTYNEDGTTEAVLGAYETTDITESSIQLIVSTILATEYEGKLLDAYKRYQEWWCIKHGYDYEKVLQAYLKGEKYYGKMFMDLDEYEEKEFNKVLV